MSDGTILDIALALIVILVATIGYFRGVSRGLLVLAGLLLGSEFALWWSDSVGDWFADLLNSPVSDTRFACALVLLLLSAVFAGVIPSNLLVSGPGSNRSRIGGVAVGFWTALLGIGFTIRLYEFSHEGMTTPDLLINSRISQFTWEHFDQVILFSVLTVAGFGLVAWILGQEDSKSSQTGSIGAQSRSKPAIVAPERETVAASVEVKTKPSIEAIAGREPANRGIDRAIPIEDQPPEVNDFLEETVRLFCPNCGMDVKQTDLFCPDCGADLE